MKASDRPMKKPTIAQMEARLAAAEARNVETLRKLEESEREKYDLKNALHGIEDDSKRDQVSEVERKLIAPILLPEYNVDACSWDDVRSQARFMQRRNVEWSAELVAIGVSVGLSTNEAACVLDELPGAIDKLKKTVAKAEALEEQLARTREAALDLLRELGANVTALHPVHDTAPIPDFDDPIVVASMRAQLQRLS